MSMCPERSNPAIAVGATVAAAWAWRFQGALRVTTIVKASFAFACDDVMACVEPQPLLCDEIHHENSPLRSVRFTTDFVPYLNVADVLFTGRAHAPPDTAVSHVRLGLFDGSRALLDKALVVRWPNGKRDLPVTYENAYGGIGWRDNPYGSGAGASRGTPSIIDPTNERRASSFAPIGSAWPSRKGLLRGLPPDALSAPCIELPEDFDWTFYQAAPPDQRVPFLRGDEWIVMDGLHPRMARARMRLPGARGLARIHGLAPFGIPEGQPLALHADMLRIDGDVERCTLSFRGTFAVPSQDAFTALRIVAGIELPGAPIPWPAEGAISVAPRAFGSDSTVRNDCPSALSDACNLLDGTIEIGRPNAIRAPWPFVTAPAGTLSLTKTDSRSPRDIDLGGTTIASVEKQTAPEHDFALPFAVSHEVRPVLVPPAAPLCLPSPPSIVVEPATPAVRAPAPPPRIIQATSEDTATRTPVSAPRRPEAPPPTPPRPPQSLLKGLYGRFGARG